MVRAEAVLRRASREDGEGLGGGPGFCEGVEGEETSRVFPA